MKYRRIELWLMMMVAVLFTYAAAVAEQQDRTADNLIRLHVIAKSDCSYDQQIKLKVRDAVLQNCSVLLDDDETIDEVTASLAGGLQQLHDTAENTLKKLCAEEKVEVKLEKEYYPTRYYENFALPAGQYCGIKVIIGEGKGKNWWCVAFPPLCTDAAADPVVQKLPKATSLRFKTAEWIGKLRNTR